MDVFSCKKIQRGVPENLITSGQKQSSSTFINESAKSNCFDAGVTA